MSPGKLESPRLASLHRQISDGRIDAMDRFWSEMAARAGPLIEPSLDEIDHSLLTFIWRGAPDCPAVKVRISLDDTGKDEHEMVLLEGTNLWYKTFHVRNDYWASYKFICHHFQAAEETIEQADPFNRATFIEPKDGERPDHQQDDVDSIVRLPAAPQGNWVTPADQGKEGNLARYELRSEILDNERRVWIYIPSAPLEFQKSLELLIVLDGRYFAFAVQTPLILENLLANGRIPPLIAVFVDNPGDTWQQAMDTRHRELSCHAPFADFLAHELMPWVREMVEVTHDPAQVTIAGGSAGGLAASFAALHYPEVFGNTISLSAPFWWKPEAEREWEWLSRKVSEMPLQPLRFFIEVGLLESSPSASGFPGQLLSNRHFRNVLRAKGYSVHYRERMHGHDSMCWQDILPEALITLISPPTD